MDNKCCDNMSQKELSILHLGDPMLYNPELYAQLGEQFNIIRPSSQERERPEFIKALREEKWGAFHCIMRPF